MARKSQRFAFTGPWRGLNDAQPDENMGPEWFRTGTDNIEVNNGYVRPRRGHDKYPSLANNTVGTLDPQSQRQVMIGAWLESNRNYDDLFTHNNDDPGGMVWRRVFRESTPTHGWVRVSADPNTASVMSLAYDFQVGTNRGCFWKSDDRVFLTRCGNNTYVMHRQVNFASESSGTSDGVTSSTTIRLDTIVGTTSTDRTYTDDQCEIELLTGTGAGQVRQISAYDHTGGAAERLATVSEAWSTNPDSTTTYRIYRVLFRRAGLPEVAESFTPSSLAGTNLPDTHSLEYAITYYDTATSLESNPVLVSATTGTGGNRDITLTWSAPQTVYSNDRNDLHANYYKIYRRDITDSETTYRYVGQVAIAAGTYNDTTSNANRTTATVESDHGEPPNGAWGCQHRGRNFIIQYGTNTIWFSKTTDTVTGLTGTEYFPAQNFFVLPQPGPAYAIRSFGSQLIAWQEDRCYSIDTSPLPDAPPFITEVFSAPGTRCPWSIVESEATDTRTPSLYYANDRGAFEFDGATARDISGSIKGVWSALSTQFLGQFTGVYDHNYDRYVLTVMYNGDSRFRRWLVYDRDSDSWLPWTFTNLHIHSVTSLCTAYDYNRNRVVYMGFQGGPVGWWSRPEEEYTDDDGTAIGWTLLSPRLDLGDPVAKKHVREVAATFRAATNAATTLGVYVNADGSLTTSDAFTLGTYQDATLYVGTEAQHIGVSLVGTAATPSLVLTGYMINWEDRRLRG